MATANHPAGGPIWEHIRRPGWVRLINATGAALRRVGVRWPRLDVGTLLAAARRRSGLSDFGDGRFREGLGVLIDAFNACDDAHAFGRIVFSNHVVSLLVNRLKIQADLTRHPEILDIPLDRPIFITGLPRSGTTFLHRLMSEDPDGRTLRTWEGLMPCPPDLRDLRDRPPDRPRPPPSRPGRPPLAAPGDGPRGRRRERRGGQLPLRPRLPVGHLRPPLRSARLHPLAQRPRPSAELP
jgi:hypothetical protein